MDGQVHQGNLRAVLLITAGTQIAIEMNTYLKINWAATVKHLVAEFADKTGYQSLRRFSPIINAM